MGECWGLRAKAEQWGGFSDPIADLKRGPANCGGNRIVYHKSHVEQSQLVLHWGRFASIRSWWKVSSRFHFSYTLCNIANYTYQLSANKSLSFLSSQLLVTSSNQQECLAITIPVTHQEWQTSYLIAGMLWNAAEMPLVTIARWRLLMKWLSVNFKADWILYRSGQSG